MSRDHAVDRFIYYSYENDDEHEEIREERNRKRCFFICECTIIFLFCIGEFPQCLFSNPFFYCPIFHIENFLYHEEY